MERDAGARLFGWTVGPGCLSGVVAAVLVAAVMSSTDDTWGPFWATAAIASFYGAVIGAITGFVIGLPVALVVGVLRRHTDHWRGLGAALAGAVTIVVGLFSLGFFGTPVVACLAAGSAWWGLDRIFEPQPASCRRTPSADPEP